MRECDLSIRLSLPHDIKADLASFGIHTRTRERLDPRSFARGKTPVATHRAHSFLVLVVFHSQREFYVIHRHDDDDDDERENRSPSYSIPLE